MASLSIITVHYKDFASLELTLHSVAKIKKSGPSIEWVVIDGGSNFVGAENLRGAVEQTADVFISERDFGIYDAMNKGLKSATGDFVIFMNAGDCFAEEFSIQALMPRVGMEDVSMIWGAAYEGTHLNRQLKVPRDVDALWYGMPTHHQAMLFRTSLAKKHLYDVSCTIAADYKLVCNVAREIGYRVVISPIPICVFDLTGVSSNRFWLGLQQQQTIRREVLKIGVFLNLMVYVLKAAARIARFALPSIYTLIRYKKCA